MYDDTDFVFQIKPKTNKIHIETKNTKLLEFVCRLLTVKVVCFFWNYTLYCTRKTMDLSPWKQQMQKTIDFLATELKSIQVGRASATMLDSVIVKASYGEMKINSLAHISVLDAQTLKVEPRDKKEAKHIASAIFEAQLGLTPNNE